MVTIVLCNPTFQRAEKHLPIFQLLLRHSEEEAWNLMVFTCPDSTTDIEDSWLEVPACSIPVGNSVHT